ncbi:MAG: hypothetical protein NTU95_11230 [Methanothrix sp.]|nr:hypothetical protein [Methanothrix sp.]
MDEDEVLSKITKLLEQGCTMLATHHDCGAPLFRCRGEVVCPVCSFADEPNSQARARPSGLSGAELEEKPKSDRAHLPEREEIDEELIAAIGNLRVSLLHRLREIAAVLEDEHDPDKLKKQLDCLEGLLRVLRSLQR